MATYFATGSNTVKELQQTALIVEPFENIEYKLIMQTASIINDYSGKCSSIANYAFYGREYLNQVYFPSCTRIGNHAFDRCSNLVSISFPACTLISTYAFQSCTALSTTNFSACTSIRSYAFTNCSRLMSLYLTGSSFVSLAHSNAFTNTPMANSTYLGYFGSIYVPSSMLESYKTMTGWSIYSNRLVGV